MTAPSPTATLQGTAIAIDGRAALLTGPPGAGKSDLALRLIGRGARLIADDLVAVSVADQRLHVGPPLDAAPGAPPRLHVAHIGVVAVETAGTTPLALVAEIGPRPDRGASVRAVALLPGWHIPCVDLAALEASAPDKLLLALARWGH